MAENWPGPRDSTWSTPSVVLWVFFSVVLLFFLNDFCAQLSLGQFATEICINLFLTLQL